MSRVKVRVPVRRRAVMAVLIAVAPLAACQASSASRDAAPRGGASAEAREVQVIAATEDGLIRAIAVTGTLAAEEQVTLSMKVTGRLNDLYVDLGSRVTRGQVLARLVPTDFNLRENQAEAALQQARARLGLPVHGDDDTIDPEKTGLVRSAQALLLEAQLTRDRTAQFVERGISPKAALDSADASLKVAESRYQDAIEEVRNRQAILEQRRTELELARQAVRDSSLTSPLDGMVRERHVTAGQYLAAGSPVVTIVRMHPLRLRVAVPEREAQSVRVNQTVRVTVEGDTTAYTGRVARISPAIDEGSRTLMVEAEVPNRDGVLAAGLVCQRVDRVGTDRPGRHRAHRGAGHVCRRGEGPERERRQGHREARHRRTPGRRAHRDHRRPGRRRSGDCPARQPGRRHTGPRAGGTAPKRGTAE